MKKSPIIQQRAKTLRKRMTDAERILWRLVRDSRLAGKKFRRQEPIGQYIADFVCYEEHLIVEVDGGQHLESSSDETRSKWLRSQGFRIVRFWNTDVLLRREAVLSEILNHFR